LIRLVCQELEGWYLGNPQALQAAFGTKAFNSKKWKKHYRKPDEVQKPSRALEHLVPEFQKISGARLLAQHLDVQTNTSHSLHVFVEGVRRLG